MRRTVLLLTMLGAMLLAFGGVVLAQSTAPSEQRQSAERYIVLLRDGADSKRVANQHAQQHGAQVKHVYRSAIRGYSARLSPQAVDAIRRDPNVLAIDEDLPQEAFCHKSRHACDTTPPTVSGVSPSEGATDAAVGTDVTVTFSEAMDSSTITTTTFHLLKQGTTTPTISAAVTYDSTAKRATLNPDADLEAGTTYTATVEGGSDGAVVKDASGNALAQDHTWQFTTAAAGGGAPPESTQPPPTGVDRIEGDQSSAKAGDGGGTTENVAVAVIDTGIDYAHPDLNAERGINTVSPNGNQDCSSRDQNADSKDDNGHGTHVAGTVGAKDDAQGVVGVAPGTKQYAVKVLKKDGSGWRSDVICGIDWVTKNAGTLGIKVANMSLGGSGSDNNLDADCKPTDGSNDAYHIAICNSVKAGVTYVVAAGNSAKNFGGTVPATYEEVLTVTAMADTNGQPGGTWPSDACRTDEEDTSASFSNFTNTINTDQNHTIAAPGVCILSTKNGGGTTTMSGTSMASPHVAGTAALCITSSSATTKCKGGPTGVMADLRADAQGQPSSYGFKDDPNSPIRIDDAKNRYYGYLTYAGGY